MPLGLTKSGYYGGADKSFDERLRDNKVRQMAAAQNKSVKDFLEDREHFKEIAAIEAEDKANQAREDEAARMMDAQGYMPPAKEPTVGGLEDLGRGALPVIQAESRMRGREFRENKTPSLSPETELTGESINPWDAGEAGQTGEYAIGHSPWSGPAEEPIGGGLEDLGREAHSKSNVDAALKRMRIREYEESQNPPSLTPEDPELAGVRTEGWLDSTIEEPMGMLDDLRAETQAGEFEDVGRDEEDPAVKEFKELNEKAVAGDKDAEKTRADIFKGMPKEEKAMAKEELGNYYIGPGGYAINLDKVDKSLSREGDFKLLQHLPDHAKPYMLMKMGYIDKEDYEGMPESPEFHLEEMKLMKALDSTKLIQEETTKRKRMGVESAETIVKTQTEAEKIMSKDRYATATDVEKMRSHTTEKVTKMGIDYNILKDSDIMTMDLNDNELRKHIADMQDTTANKKIDEMTKNFTAQIASNEDITKWGITSDQFINTSNADLARDLKETDVTLKNIDVNIIEKQIAGVRANMISKLAGAKELSEMGISAQELIAGRTDATERYKVTSRKTVDLATIRQAGDHFTKTIAFKYKALKDNTLFKNVQLAQLSATEIMKHNRLSEEQRQTWFVRQHTANQQVADTLWNNGQIEQAMMVMAPNGVSKPPNLTNFWKMRGQKLKGTTAVQEAVTAMGVTFEKANTGYLKALNKMHTDLISPKQVQDEYTALDIAVMETGEKPWQEMNDEERANQKDTMGRPIKTYLHWKAAKTQETIDRNMKDGIYGGYHGAMKGDEMRIQLAANKKDNQKKNGKAKPTDELSTAISGMNKENLVEQINEHVAPKEKVKLDSAINKMSDATRKILQTAIRTKKRPTRSQPVGQMLYDIVESFKGDRGTMLNYILRGGEELDLGEDQNPFAIETL